MSLASRISARSRRPTATVTIGGRVWARGVLSLSRSQEYGQAPSTGTVVGRDPPVTITEGVTPISWRWGYDGYEVPGFSGVVVKITQESYPRRWRLQVADELWRANVKRGDISTSPLNNILASEAIRQILAGAGITRVDIPALPASGSEWAGSEWTLGTLTPVTFPSTTALAAAQQIAAVLGYWLYCDASGTVRAVLMERRPSSSPFRTLEWGRDFVLSGPPNRTRDAEARRNKVVVTGANTGVEGAQIRDERIAGAGDRQLDYNSPLIEYVNAAEAGDASAESVATRLLALWNRQPNMIEAKIKADPRLGVGATLGIVCPPIGYSSSVPFFVYRISTDLDVRRGAFDQTLTLDGGVGDAGYSTIPNPIAAMTWRIVREGLDGVGVVELFLDGSGSQSLSGGEIVAWAWASATATLSPYPATASGPRAMFVYPAGTLTAEVTLTVTDTSSKIGTLTQTIDLTGDALTAPTSETLVIALGSAVAATPNGGQAWNVTATGDATLAPEYNGDDLIATRGTGATGLRRSRDAGATWENLEDYGATITALDRTRGAPDRLWVGLGANLRRSLDGGVTSAPWGTLPAPIRGVIEDPALFNSVFVLAGNTLYQSTSPANPGTAWVPLYVGPSGAVGRQVVRGLSGATTLIAYTGTFIGSPLHRVEGPVTALFPLDASPPVTEIRAVALSPDELTAYAFDAQARLWVVDTATMIATLSAATLPGGSTVQHALHSPTDPIVYISTFNTANGPAYKYFPLIDAAALFYSPAAGQQAHRIGLGGTLRRPFQLLLIPSGASGGDDVIHHYIDGAYRSITPPKAGWRWQAIRAAPFAPSTWLLLGNSAAGGVGLTKYDVVGGVIKAAGTSDSPLWLTQDAGATWAPVTLSHPYASSYTAGTFSVADLGGYGLAWDTETGGRWLLYGASDNVGAVGNARWVYRGNLTTVPTPTHAAGNTFGPLISGAEGEAVLATGFPNGMLYYEAAGAFTRPSGSDITIGTGYRMAREPGPSRRVAAGASALGAIVLTADYRSAQPTVLTSSYGADTLVWATHGLYRGSGAGLRKINVATGADEGGPTPNSTLTGHVSVDAQTRATVAWRDTTGGVYVYDGAAVAQVAEPGPVADFVEVIGETV